ncbi:MAG: hypothetical protein C4297_05435 [Gemmataceae bacterium]
MPTAFSKLLPNYSGAYRLGEGKQVLGTDPVAAGPIRSTGLLASVDAGATSPLMVWAPGFSLGPAAALGQAPAVERASPPCTGIIQRGLPSVFAANRGGRR